MDKNTTKLIIRRIIKKICGIIMLVFGIAMCYLTFCLIRNATEILQTPGGSMLRVGLDLLFMLFTSAYGLMSILFGSLMVFRIDI